MNVMNKMNRVITVLYKSKATILFLLLIAILGCHPSKHHSGKPLITVSILPQKYFVEKIAGDKYDVNVMVPPGASHENYDPTPKQIVGLSNAVVYFRVGNIDFEKTWIQKFSENYPDLKFVNLSKKLDLIESADDNHHHGQTEPHTWMSPRNVKSMAKIIYETLVEMDMKNESFYTLNYKLFIQELDSLNELVRTKFQHSKSNSFIIYHPALTYYARDFGLIQWVIELEGKSPSVQHIRDLIDIAKREKIKAVLVQKQFDVSKAETIANEIGGIVIEIDPLNENWSKEIVDITNKLSEAFNKQSN
jgi:zinc transport system substrate-binding protein